MLFDSSLSHPATSTTTSTVMDHPPHPSHSPTHPHHPPDSIPPDPPRYHFALPTLRSLELPVPSPLPHPPLPAPGFHPSQSQPHSQWPGISRPSSTLPPPPPGPTNNNPYPSPHLHPPSHANPPLAQNPLPLPLTLPGPSGSYPSRSERQLPPMVPSYASHMAPPLQSQSQSSSTPIISAHHPSHSPSITTTPYDHARRASYPYSADQGPPRQQYGYMPSPSPNSGYVGGTASWRWQQQQQQHAQQHAQHQQDHLRYSHHQHQSHHQHPSQSPAPHPHPQDYSYRDPTPYASQPPPGDAPPLQWAPPESKGNGLELNGTGVGNGNAPGAYAANGQHVNHILKEVIDNCQAIINFAAHYGTLAGASLHSPAPSPGQTHGFQYTPPPEKLAEMVARAINVVRLLQSLAHQQREEQQNQLGKHARESSPPRMQLKGMVQQPALEDAPVEQVEEASRAHKRRRVSELQGSVDGARPSKYKKRSRATPPAHCASCGTTETPEWRKGPDGARTLCNACGLHFSKLSKQRERQPGPPIDIAALRTSARILPAQQNSNSANNSTGSRSPRIQRSRSDSGSLSRGVQPLPPPNNNSTATAASTQGPDVSASGWGQPQHQQQQHPEQQEDPRHFWGAPALAPQQQQHLLHQYHPVPNPAVYGVSPQISDVRSSNVPEAWNTSMMQGPPSAGVYGPTPPPPQLQAHAHGGKEVNRVVDGKRAWQ